MSQNKRKNIHNRYCLSHGRTTYFWEGNLLLSQMVTKYSLYKMYKNTQYDRHYNVKRICVIV
jgi:hypothetical protein